MDNLINHPFVLLAFAIIVFFMLLLDLGIFNKKSHVISNKEAAIWSVVWISLSMVFSIFIYIITNETSGIEKFAQFQSAYWIEKALSVDNLFVFILVFNFFQVPRQYQHKVLFWGILGAIVFRAIFIFLGVELINLTYLPEMNLLNQNVRINLVLTVFGLFLIYAGIKSWLPENHEVEKDFRKNIGARLVSKFYTVSSTYDGGNFFTVQNGVKMATPLLVVVAIIEFTDILFAIDSIPAIFAIAPDDPFILYTSNIFAILGLRSLYFLLANSLHIFSRLKYGVAVILIFIGVKMLIAPFFHFSSALSLSIIFGILIISILSSIIFPVENK